MILLLHQKITSANIFPTIDIKWFQMVLKNVLLDFIEDRASPPTSRVFWRVKIFHNTDHVSFVKDVDYTEAEFFF